MSASADMSSTAPAMTHSDPWAHDFICCDLDHSASASNSPFKVPSSTSPSHHHSHSQSYPHSSTTHTSTWPSSTCQGHASCCNHVHGPIGVGSRRNTSSSDIGTRNGTSTSNASSTSATPTNSTLPSPVLLPTNRNTGIYGPLVQPFSHTPPPRTHTAPLASFPVTCQDPNCSASEPVSCKDPHCNDGAIEPCQDPTCREDEVQPCDDPHCEIDGTDVCMDPHCEDSIEATGDICKDPHCRENGDQAGSGAVDLGVGRRKCEKCDGQEGCKDCGLEALEQWACSKEGTQAIQQYLECCSQVDCTLPIFSPSVAGGKSQAFPHTHADQNIHHHLLSTLPSNNDQIIPVPPNVSIPFSLDSQLNQTNVSSHTSTPINQDSNFQVLAHITNSATSTTSGSLGNTPAPVTAPPTSGPVHVVPANVCHWQNCHRVFDTMPDLLTHVANDHLGAHGLTSSHNVGTLATPQASAEQQQQQPPTSTISANIVDQLQGLLGAGTGLDAQPTQPVGTNLPSSGLPQPGVNPFSGDPNTELLSCLWDDCFPLSECKAEAPGACATHAHMPAHPNVSHQHHQYQHSHPFHGQSQTLTSQNTPGTTPLLSDGNASTFTSHGQAGANSTNQAVTHHAIPEQPFSPQTMLRHVLEEHLGVPSSIIGWNNDQNVLFGNLNTDSVNGNGNATTSANLAAMSHNLGMAHSHLHSHAPHLISQTGHDIGQNGLHNTQHMDPAHTHNHSWMQPHICSHGHHHSSLPISHSHVQPSAVEHGMHKHCDGHSHSHDNMSHLPTPSTTHHTPSPPSNTTVTPRRRLNRPMRTHNPSDAHSQHSETDLMCQWTGCSHPGTFEDTTDLMTHISEEHVGKGKDSYLCLWDGCDRTFRSRQKVLRHLQSHTGHKPYICEECGQGFGEAAPLAAHMRRHAKERPFKCEYPGCGKTFAISSSLTIHMRTHNGEKPFVCPHCNKGFVEASNLTKHIRTHTGERPFACTHPGCAKRFSRPDQLKRHMKIHEDTSKMDVRDKVDLANSHVQVVA